LFEIARRAAAGLDLRPTLEKLEAEDEVTRAQGMSDLKSFAIANRPYARDELAKILKIKDRFSAYPDVKLGAADALCALARSLPDSENEYREDLYWLAAEEGYEPLLKQVFAAHRDRQNAAVRVKVGEAYLAIGRGESVKARKVKARDAFRAAAQ